MIQEVPKNRAGEVWPIISPMIERALRHGQGDQTSLDQLLWGIEAGVMSLWLVVDGQQILASVILSVSEFPGTKKLYVEILAGERMSEWEDELEGLLRDYMGLVGAECIEASCRRGLAEHLRARGWRKKAIIMELK